MQEVSLCRPKTIAAYESRSFTQRYAVAYTIHHGMTAKQFSLKFVFWNAGGVQGAALVWQ